MNFSQDSRWKRAARLSSSYGTRYGIFGGDVALIDSDIAVAASGYFNRRPGSVQIFAPNEDGLWSEDEHIQDVEDIFIALDSDGHELLIGQARGGRSRSGLATLYAKDSTDTWQLTASLKPPTPYSEGGFGTEVALSGDIALVVGYDEQLRLNYNVDRVVYVFRRQNGQWSYQGIIDIGQFAFASSMDLDGDYALIGASSPEGRWSRLRDPHSVADMPSAAWLLEAAAVLTGFLCVWLNVRQNIWTWPVTILSCVLFGAYCSMRHVLYGTMGLQGLFIIIAVYGWHSWLTGGAMMVGVWRCRRITFEDQAGDCCLSRLVFCLSIYFGLSEYTDASFPRIDAVTTALSISASWMQAKKILRMLARLDSDQCDLHWLAPSQRTVPYLRVVCRLPHLGRSRIYRLAPQP